LHASYFWEIHLLELPKYSPVDDNEVIADPRDHRLPDPVFQRAVGVLEMISRTPDQRRHYDARLKWELDENTRIQTAFEEGELFGKIRMLQNLLSLPQSTDDALRSRSRTELQAQLRKRMS